MITTKNRSRVTIRTPYPTADDIARTYGLTPSRRKELDKIVDSLQATNEDLQNALDVNRADVEFWMKRANKAEVRVREYRKWFKYWLERGPDPDAIRWQLRDALRNQPAPPRGRRERSEPEVPQRRAAQCTEVQHPHDFPRI